MNSFLAPCFVGWSRDLIFGNASLQQTKGAVQLDGRVDFTIETYDEHRNLLPLSAKLHRKGVSAVARSFEGMHAAWQMAADSVSFDNPPYRCALFASFSQCTGKHPEVHLKDGKAKSKGNNRLVGSFKIVPRTESMKGGLLSKKGKECNINVSCKRPDQLVSTDPTARPHQTLTRFPFALRSITDFQAVPWRCIWDFACAHRSRFVFGSATTADLL